MKSARSPPFLRSQGLLWRATDITARRRARRLQLSRPYRRGPGRALRRARGRLARKPTAPGYLEPDLNVIAHEPERTVGAAKTHAGDPVSLGRVVDPRAGDAESARDVVRLEQVGVQMSHGVLSVHLQAVERSLRANQFAIANEPASDSALARRFPTLASRISTTSPAKSVTMPHSPVDPEIWTSTRGQERRRSCSSRRRMSVTGTLARDERRIITAAGYHGRTPLARRRGRVSPRPRRPRRARVQDGGHVEPRPRRAARGGCSRASSRTARERPATSHHRQPRERRERRPRATSAAAFSGSRLSVLVQFRGPRLVWAAATARVDAPHRGRPLPVRARASDGSCVPRANCSASVYSSSVQLRARVRRV